MKVLKTFIIGSNAFFSNIPGFKAKDIDELSIVDKTFGKSDVINIKFKNKDVFFYKEMSKQDFIKNTLDSNVPMKAGKFLIPDFVNYLGFTIEDLKKLKQCFDNIDSNHLYEKYIFDFYIKNNQFNLTKDQLDKVYKIYLNNRKNGNRN